MRQLRSFFGSRASYRVPVVVFQTLAPLAVLLAVASCARGSDEPTPRYRVFFGDRSFTMPIEYSVRPELSDGIVVLISDPFAPVFESTGSVGPGGFSKIHVGSGDVYGRVTTAEMRQLLGEPIKTYVGDVELLTWATPVTPISDRARMAVVRCGEYEAVILSEDSRLPNQLAGEIASNRPARSAQATSADGHTQASELAPQTSIADAASDQIASSIAEDAQLRPLFRNGLHVGYVVGRDPSPGSLLATAGVRSGEVLQAIQRRASDGATRTFTAERGALLAELARGGPMVIVVRTVDSTTREVSIAEDGN